MEFAHPERAWIADVMAIHDSGKWLAFEVQLSIQSEEEYIRRSQRYLDDGVGPVWIVPEDHDDFRVLLPIIVTGFGKSSDLPQAPEALTHPFLSHRYTVALTVQCFGHPPQGCKTP